MKTKEELLATQDENIVPVDVAEWGDTLYIRRLTGAEVSKLRSLGAVGKKEPTYIMAATCCMAICDESGASVFTIADAAALEKKSYKALDYLSTEILIHSGCLKREGEGEEKN